jgi:predicted nucleic acid-binding protein
VSSAPPRVYLDSNVFIAAFERTGAHSDHAWWIIHAIEQGEIVGATSEITLAEILVNPIERGATDLASGYDKMITSGPTFEVLPVRRDILVAAAEIRARRASIRLPDAVHMATARNLSCTYFVSDDQRLSVPDGIKLLDVNPFTLDDIFKEQA